MTVGRSDWVRFPALAFLGLLDVEVEVAEGEKLGGASLANFHDL